MPPRYDPFANGGRGGYVADPLDEARATLGRADAFSRSIGSDLDTGSSLDIPEPASTPQRGGLRRLTEAIATPSIPLGVGALATGLTGIGAPLAAPLAGLSALSAAPDVLRRLISPEEDESRGGAALEAGLYVLPAAGPALRGLRSASTTAKSVMPTLDDVVRGADMYADAGSRSGGLAARSGEKATAALPESWRPFSTPEAMAATKAPKSAISVADETLMGDDGVAALANEGSDTLGYSSPGMWDQADAMFEQAQRAVPFDDMARYSGIRNNPKAKQALLDASRDARGLPRLGRGVGMLDDAVPMGDEVDLSLETRGGLTEAARRAQDLARRFRSNRPSTEF